MLQRETDFYIPDQSRRIMAPLSASNSEIQAGAECLKANEPLVFDNQVYALVVNANDPQAQEKIAAIKGDRRGAKQPIGWTVPFQHSLDVIDKDVITNRKLRELLDDPDELTRRIGGLAFVLTQASMPVKERRNLPDAIFSSSDQFGSSTVMLYSPTGNDATSRLVRTSMAHGVEPAMTSANVSGKQREIVTEKEAREFARRVHPPLKLIVNQPDELKSPRPRGSYPILRLTPEGLLMIRSGCFDIEILQRLLDGYQVREAAPAEFRHGNYPEGILHLNDIDPQREFGELRRLRGPELRSGLVALLKWHTDNWDVLQSDSETSERSTA